MDADDQRLRRGIAIRPPALEQRIKAARGDERRDVWIQTHTHTDTHVNIYDR